MAKRFNRLSSARAVTFVIGAVVASTAALAQGWWPWANETPRPPAPIQRQLPPGPPPVPIPPQGSQQPSPAPFAGGGSVRGGICLQLEQRLASEGQRGASTQSNLPKIEADLRQNERELQRATSQLERGECWDYFLFTKSLKRSPQCLKLNSDVESLKRKVADLDAQRQNLAGSRERSYQDDIIRELARNGCGQQYVQEARRRDQQGNPFSSLWSDEESPTGGRGGNEFGSLPFATYRTICVRLCDGYYFPVSFSTLPNHFSRDADVCQSRCAAPAELYYHQNPGAGVEQATSIKGQTPYTSLKTAFRYRKEFVQGCSCNQAEFVPQTGDKKAEGPATAPAAGTASSTWAASAKQPAAATPAR
jgi:hypothetical protein